MMPWLRLRRSAPAFNLSASDLARELATLGADQRRAEHRRRVLLTADLLKRTGAKSPIAPTEGWK